MPALPNEKHEAFAKHLAQGKTASESYEAVGYRACRQNASRLSSHDDVKKRVAEIKEATLTEPDMNGRDEETGQFLTGNRRGGRPLGSRTKLSEAFLHDLHAQWLKSGATALRAVAEGDPVAFMKLVAGVLPAKIDQTLTTTDLNLLIECKTFGEMFRFARDHIGADAPGMLIEADKRYPQREMSVWAGIINGMRDGMVIETDLASNGRRGCHHDV